MTLRLIAILVLLSGVADYYAFDLGDPLAPMSAAGSPNLVDSHLVDSPLVDSHVVDSRGRFSRTTIGHTDTHDDGCIGCAAGVTADRIELLVSELIETAVRIEILPSSDPQLVFVDPPPRA